MGITFDQDTRTFHLQARDTSYVFRATPSGHLVHLYWGQGVRPADLSYLARAGGVLRAFSPGPISEGGVGYSCIAEIRMIETIADGKPSTSFMKFGDTVKIQMKDKAGKSIFGAIEQTVVKYEK